MSKHVPHTHSGTAAEGVCRPDPDLWALPGAEHPSLPIRTDEALALESYELLRSRDEEMLFDWAINILEDARVVGVLKNDYVYQSSSLHGEVHPTTGSPYLLALTRTSVEFDTPESQDAPIQFDPVIVETDGEDLEAYQVRDAFNVIRRHSALLRAWNGSTSIGSSHSTAFKNLRMLHNETEFAMDVETSLAAFTVVVRRATSPGTFIYSVTDPEIPIMHSSRVVDALLSDAAEDGGGIPEPGSLVLAMINTAWLARRDPEWIAAGGRRNSQRA